jgi:hypothetical protein
VRTFIHRSRTAERRASAVSATGHSLDISVPLVNAILTSARLRGFHITADFFYNFNPGEKQVRAVLGPGLGLAAGGGNGLSQFLLRVPAEVGLEILTREQNFGFKLLARPWFEAGRLAIEGDPLATVGGGVLVSLGIAGYRLGF